MVKKTATSGVGTTGVGTVHASVCLGTEATSKDALSELV